jgi:hypothetical protein
MLKRLTSLVAGLLLVICTTSSCASHAELVRRQYGILESAVMFSADKIAGEYGDSIPDNLDNTVFMGIVRDKIPTDYYEALQKYGLVVDPKKTYYLLKVFDRESNRLILFDYSCTPEVDGPVLLYPQEYDTEHLEKYDKCRQSGNGDVLTHRITKSAPRVESLSD